MTIKNLKALVETFDYDVSCAGHPDAQIMFIRYDGEEEDERVNIDYYIPEIDEDIHYTYSLRWERE